MIRIACILLCIMALDSSNPQLKEIALYFSMVVCAITLVKDLLHY